MNHLFLNNMKPDWIYITRKGTCKAEVKITTWETNIWPIHYKLWQERKIEKKQPFASTKIEQGRIFGTANLLNKKKYNWDIVWNSDESLIYFIEAEHLLQFLGSVEFKEIKDIEYPEAKVARKEFKRIKKRWSRHKQIMQRVIKDSIKSTS